jgi:hypothetical protein
MGEQGSRAVPGAAQQDERRRCRPVAGVRRRGCRWRLALRPPPTFRGRPVGVPSSPWAASASVRCGAPSGRDRRDQPAERPERCRGRRAHRDGAGPGGTGPRRRGEGASHVRSADPAHRRAFGWERHVGRHRTGDPPRLGDRPPWRRHRSRSVIQTRPLRTASNSSRHGPGGMSIAVRRATASRPAPHGHVASHGARTSTSTAAASSHSP